ncbi:uncharacterized protein Tco025E_03456 [Trypanosoma conorhini]|uniref:Uncharacterized protein n=1 Tax=Trypanosoma conorhini TaxID=83891 RepID=A0A3R7MW40_9TRYP|nr:uncharacterized protein Tco025E_03456 [Trypanosoma conorhini]RNF21615.1 hypothetical protein Tco025E_03456 [Trypanosoma conorhini]
MCCEEGRRQKANVASNKERPGKQKNRSGRHATALDPRQRTAAPNGTPPSPRHPWACPRTQPPTPRLQPGGQAEDKSQWEPPTASLTEEGCGKNSSAAVSRDLLYSHRIRGSQRFSVAAASRLCPMAEKPTRSHMLVTVAQ